MSLFCDSSPLKSGSVLKHLTPRHLLSVFSPVEPYNSPFKGRQLRRFKVRPDQQLFSNTDGLTKWFIRALVTAGHCQKHSAKLSRTHTFFTPSRPDLRLRHIYNSSVKRHQHGKAGDAEDELDKEFEAKNMAPNRTREELMELVDQYRSDYAKPSSMFGPNKRYQPSDGPFLSVSDKEDDEWPPPGCAWPADQSTAKTLRMLHAAVTGPERKDLDYIYDLYKSLPEPRAPYLEARTRHHMLHHLSIVEYKDGHSMLRYMSIVDDMRATAISLSVAEWTSALSFTARYAARATEVECAATLELWKEMEHVAGVKGKTATFNVLFDVACKAGKFTLAEMIFKEMLSRNFKPDRYSHVGMIFYHGLRGDGDGVRAAYENLVDAGEIVDTVVLNAMISALISCQETSAARNIYARMSRSVLSNPENAQLLPRDFLQRRTITQILKKMAVVGRGNLEAYKIFQENSIISPDARTFHILVTHYAEEAGELEQTIKLLDEMGWFQLPLQVPLFVNLFKGFARHGGVRYTDWTGGKLERVFKSLIAAVDDPKSEIEFNTSLVRSVLVAFARCAGRKRTLEVWEVVRGRWPERGEAEERAVMGLLRRVVDNGWIGWMDGSGF